MIKLNVKLLSLVLVIMLPWLNACSINTTHSPQQDQLAADIYAQLALGYMASGHLTLAQQRLNKALQLMPRGKLSLKAAQQWQAIQANRP
jgi:Tfp pilus assembly protein PilF|tara:strand:- start:660 stop:929 length:270 start_codon:yes stop_codon:yes gene_type:complete